MLTSNSELCVVAARLVNSDWCPTPLEKTI